MRSMQERSDEQLMAAVMAGDQVALAALVTRHHAPLLGYLYRLVGGDRPLAEDLVQETLLHVLRQRTFRSGRPFKPWLYTIATNLARDYFKSAAVCQRWRGGDKVGSSRGGSGAAVGSAAWAPRHPGRCKHPLPASATSPAPTGSTTF